MINLRPKEAIDGVKTDEARPRAKTAGPYAFFGPSTRKCSSAS